MRLLAMVESLLKGLSASSSLDAAKFGSQSGRQSSILACQGESRRDSPCVTGKRATRVTHINFGLNILDPYLSFQLEKMLSHEAAPGQVPQSCARDDVFTASIGGFLL